MSDLTAARDRAKKSAALANRDRQESFMGRIFESTIAAGIVGIQHAIFGRPGLDHGHGCDLDEKRALSQEFALAASLAGGGAMLAIQTLGHPSGTGLRTRHAGRCH